MKIVLMFARILAPRRRSSTAFTVPSLAHRKSFTVRIGSMHDRSSKRRMSPATMSTLMRLFRRKNLKIVFDFLFLAIRCRTVATPRPVMQKECRQKECHAQSDSKSFMLATSCFTASTLFLKSAVSLSVRASSMMRSTPPLPITTGTPT